MTNDEEYLKMTGKLLIMILLSIVGLMIILGSTHIEKKKDFTNEYRVFDLLKGKPGFVVTQEEELKPSNNISFNLKKQLLRLFESSKRRRHRLWS